MPLTSCRLLVPASGAIRLILYINRMKVDAKLQLSGDARLAGVGARAAGLEAGGYDGLWTSEAAHDPFLPVALAAQTTEHVTLGTGIAVAFARTPMTVA